MSAKKILTPTTHRNVVVHIVNANNHLHDVKNGPPLLVNGESNKQNAHFDRIQKWKSKFTSEKYILFDYSS